VKKNWRRYKKKAKELIQQNPENKIFYPKIIVRAWADIPIEHKFRGFVCKKNLNALSQYYHYCYFPKLVEDKGRLEEKILGYYESIKNLIPHENFVIDFAILPDGGMKVIEIKPFHHSVEAPFLSWKKGSEGRAKIFKGPYSLNVRTEAPVGRDKFMQKCWVKFFEIKMHQLIQKFEKEKGCVVM